ncbi:MBL fold metallo-hydrolase [Clostridium manihotivorum]|uniref:Sulfohydrolase n=1 Tax=Clostridium manihotivorum TaxID=2320868 RepID=A0A3R5QWD5_9CLOT|nr:ribonuclease Z [Clostridium manihotivorum]QAA31092.1 sulfohydrolase [Clostridium manihotivorum]
MIKITFLGTNGWFDTETGRTVSILIEHNDYYIVLDAGNGISRLPQYIKDDRPVYLFLSHFHLDHISGLHTLSLNKFSKGLYIISQPNSERIIKQFINTPFTTPIDKLPFDTHIINALEPNIELPFNATFLPLVHSTEVLGGRFEIDDKVICYCTDTAYCENVITLAKDADVLITECSMKSKETFTDKIHLNPELAAKLALEANVKKLLLMHFDASSYLKLEDRVSAEVSAGEIFNNTFAAIDGLEVEV